MIPSRTEVKISREVRDFGSDGAIRFTPEIFQRPFMKSTCAYPAFIGAWGTGKTLCGFMKGIMLSLMYPGNCGLIIRRVFNALAISTIGDFNDWTKLNVSKDKPKIIIPNSGGSRVYFSHAESLSDFRNTLQGMNLGWAEIEQCDEFDSDEVFNELEGRVRRVLTPNKEIQKALIEKGILSEYVSDFSQLGKDKRDDIEDAIMEQLHLPVRQIMLTGNANGHNWVWKRWKKNPLSDYKLFEAKSSENKANLPRSTLRRWANMKISAPKRYARMVENSWEDYDTEGAYYASLMSDLLKKGRTELDTLYDKNTMVYTFWDLGIRASDTTAIWFVQFVEEEIRLIDYLEDYGKGMDFYSKALSEKPYEYAAHYLPPDSVQRLQGREITTRLDIMRMLRREPIRVVERHHIAERIACVRGLLNRCKFTAKCEKGVDALNNYKRKRNETTSTEENPRFLAHPADDVWTNGADSFGYMAIVYRYNPPRSDIAFSSASDDSDFIDDDSVDAGSVNLLSVR